MGTEMGPWKEGYQGTMAIDGAKNAALYAVSILALNDAGLAEKLKEFRQKQSDKVLQTVL